MTNLKLSFFVILFSALYGCKQEPSIVDVCIDRLNYDLETWATYGGWSTSDIKSYKPKYTANDEYNKKYKSNNHYDFKVTLHNFTVKNGFNADKRSISTCKGLAIEDKGTYKVIGDKLTLEMTLNGKKLGI